MKKYNTGSLTADSAGNASHTSAFPIVGKIEKLYLNLLNSDAGSVTIQSSGATNETIIQNLGFSASSFFYPRVNICDNAATTINAGSGNNSWTEYVISNKVNFVFSGIGAGSSVFARIFYV